MVSVPLTGLPLANRLELLQSGDYRMETIEMTTRVLAHDEVPHRSRAHQGGSVYFRSARNAWVAEVRRPDGRTVTRMAKSRAAAESLLIRLQADVHGGVRRAGRGLLAGDWFHTWLGLLSDVTPKTLMGYRSAMENHWLRLPIATLPLASVKPKHVTMALDSIGVKTTGRRLSQQSKIILRSVLSAAFSYAVERGMIDANPVTAVRMKQAGPQRARLQDISEERWKAIHEAVVDSPLRALYHLLLDSSLRLGEALALRWEDVNFGKPSEGKNPKVFVRAAIKERPRKDGRGVEQYRGTTKTHGSVRSVFINPETAVLLHQLRRSQNKSTGLVFRRGADPDQELNKGTVSREFRGRMAAAGITGVTVRDLRHWAPTILLSKGHSLVTVSKRMGHASVSTTANRYVHVVSQDESKAAETLTIWSRTHRSRTAKQKVHNG
jgi:integrase